MLLRIFLFLLCGIIFPTANMAQSKLVQKLASSTSVQTTSTAVENKQDTVTASEKLLNRDQKIDIQLHAAFDIRNVAPQYIVGVGTILVAISTIVIVWITSRQTIKATNKYAEIQLLTNTSHNKTNLEIATKERIASLNSKNRQYWVNDLRNCTADYLRLLNDLNFLNKTIATYAKLYEESKKEHPSVESIYTDPELAETYKKQMNLKSERGKKYSELCFFSSKIELLLSPTPSGDEKKLSQLIKLSSDRNGDFSKVSQYMSDISLFTKKIIKSEWDIIIEATSGQISQNKTKS